MGRGIRWALAAITATGIVIAQSAAGRPQRSASVVAATVIHEGQAKALAAAARDPAVARVLLLRYAKLGSSSGRVTGARIAASGCWGGSWAEEHWSVLGRKIGWIRKYQDGYCTNGRKITRDFGWGHATWTWGPYCMTNESERHGWDIYPSWKHGGAWGSMGVSYPWGCGGLRGGHAVIRIAGNGHWDNYDDYGY